MNRRGNLRPVLAAMLLVSAAWPADAREPGERKKHVSTGTRIAGVLLGAAVGLGAGALAGKAYDRGGLCNDDDGCVVQAVGIAAAGMVTGAVAGYFVSGAVAGKADRALDEGRAKVRLAQAERARRDQAVTQVACAEPPRE